MLLLLPAAAVAACPSVDILHASQLGEISLWPLEPTQNSFAMRCESNRIESFDRSVLIQSQSQRIHIRIEVGGCDTSKQINSACFVLLFLLLLLLRWEIPKNKIIKRNTQNAALMIKQKFQQNFLTFAFYFTRFFESITQTGNKNTAEDDEPRERVEKRVLEILY